MEQNGIKKMREKMNKKNIVREELKDSLLQEFKKIHERLMNDLLEKDSIDEMTVELVNLNLKLASQIVREERALNGESAYLL